MASVNSANSSANSVSLPVKASRRARLGALWVSLRPLVIGLAIGLAIVAGVTVPRAGWTTRDVTTGHAPGYPDLVPRRYDIPASNATRVAAQVTTLLPGWKTVYLGAEAGEMQAEVRALPFLMPDDVTLKVRPVGPDDRYSEVLIRSHSRWGWADFGANARHIRDLQAAMDDKLPQVP